MGTGSMRDESDVQIKMRRKIFLRAAQVGGDTPSSVSKKLTRSVSPPFTDVAWILFFRPHGQASAAWVTKLVVGRVCGFLLCMRRVFLSVTRPTHPTNNVFDWLGGASFPGFFSRRGGWRVGTSGGDRE